MTYKEAIVMRQNLNQINQVNGTSAKFLYAVSRNKDHLDSLIKHLNNTIEQSDDIRAYRNEVDKLNEVHAFRNEEGEIEYVNVPGPGGQQRRAFKKIVGQNNPESDYEKSIARIEKKYAIAIKNHEEKIASYEKMLDNDITEGELRLFMIDLDIVPDGINPKAMDGLLPFIRQVE